MAENYLSSLQQEKNNFFCRCIQNHQEPARRQDEAKELNLSG
jgi:hypothetical protein